MTRWMGIGLLGAWLSAAGASLGAGPVIETDRGDLLRARERLAGQEEPFWSYWQAAKVDAREALQLAPQPRAFRDPLKFHGTVQEQGIAARLLAYWWWLEGSEAAAKKALELLDAWASADPRPGLNFDPEIRYPNAGMDVARGVLPFVVTYDLLREHPGMTVARRERVEDWFRGLSDVVREGVRRWEANDDFGKQEFQNHHASHVLGLVLFGAVLGDDEMLRFALDSPENPKDFKELVAGLILMPGDRPHGGLRGKPLHAGEIQDRYRTSSGAGLTYCHLTMTLLLYTAETLTRVTGEDYLHWTAAGGECLRLPFTFYSDFFRTRNARINGDYYFRDQPYLRNNTPFLGVFEVALHHWPDVPNLRAIVRSMDRARTPRSWLCYYGLPLLTHGVVTP